MYSFHAYGLVGLLAASCVALSSCAQDQSPSKSFLSDDDDSQANVNDVTETGGRPPQQGGASSKGGTAAPTGGSSSNAEGGTRNPEGGTSSEQGGSSAAGALSTGGRSAGGTPALTGGSATGGTEAAEGGANTGEGGSGTALPKFSFFATSQARLFALAEAFNGSTNGFGGDLRYGEMGTGAGLKGADRICAEIAETSMPGSSAKQWRAFLSISVGPDGGPVNAIDRVGSGPWYDRLGRLVASSVSDLQSTRPAGADAAIVDDLPNEDGEPNHRPGGVEIDNHNVLTGSDGSGRLATSRVASPTCQDWTDATTGSTTSNVGPYIGNSWWGGTGVGTESRGWIYCGHNAAGCQPGAIDPYADLGFGVGQGGVNCGTVGCMGGYGGIYCFALEP